jgi:hypothetical protein
MKDQAEEVTELVEKEVAFLERMKGRSGQEGYRPRKNSVC